MMWGFILIIIIIIGYHLYKRHKKFQAQQNKIKKTALGLKTKYHQQTPQFRYWHRNREASYREKLYCKRRLQKSLKINPQSHYSQYWKKRYRFEKRYYKKHYILKKHYLYRI